MKLFTKFMDTVVYRNDWELIHHEKRRSQDFLAWEAVAGATGLALIQGIFQTRFLLKVGADIDALSLLSSLTLVASISCLFGGLLFDKKRKKKMLIVWMLTLARLCMAGTVFLPFLLGATPLCVGLIIGITVAAQAVTTLADTGYNSLLSAIIPPRMRGRVLAARSMLNYMINPLVPLAGAFYLDRGGDTLIPFAVLAAISTIFILLEGFLISRVEEPVYTLPEGKNKSAKEMWRTFRKQLGASSGFMKLIGECFIFYTFLYICGTFTSTYMNSTDYLGIGALIIQIATVGMHLVMAVLCQMWGRMCDRVGSAKMTFLLFAVFGVEMLMWVVVPPQWMPFALAIPYLMQAASNSLSGVALTSRKFELLPEENRSLFLGLFGFVMAVAYLIGPAIGRFLLHYFEKHLPAGMLADFWQIRFIYLISAVLIFGQRLVCLCLRRYSSKTNSNTPPANTASTGK